MKISDEDLEKSVDFLLRLLKTPSPTGYCERAINLIIDELKPFNAKFKIMNKGGLVVTIPGTNDEEHRAICAHVDTLGGMVREIKKKGRIKFSPVGGFMFQTVEGEYCTIFTSEGKEYTGTIVHKKTSIHVYARKLQEKGKYEETDVEIRLDEVVSSADDVKKLGIAIGDFIIFDPRAIRTSSNFIKSRHLDDKAGVTIMLVAIKHILENKLTLPFTTHFYVTIYEETGHGASSGLPSTVNELVAIDMGAIGEGQSSDEFSVCICAKDANGPYDYSLRRRLEELCKKHNIKYCVDIYSFYGSDAATALRAGADIKFALIGPGVDASHAFERTHLDSIKHSINLTLAYCLES
ncbi:MAG: M42 family metallopeptidase [Candidatus Hodarchaeota archaeon]